LYLLPPLPPRKVVEYAVQVCPFMLDPGRVPRDCDLPSTTDVVVDPGILGANPGVSLLWTTKRYWPSRLDKRAITVGDPTRVRWWTKGRLATHAEAVAALNLTVEQDLARVRRTYFYAEAAPGYRAYVDAINTKLRSLHALLPFLNAASQGRIWTHAISRLNVNPIELAFRRRSA
jgi:hypothetical protein